MEEIENDFKYVDFEEKYIQMNFFRTWIRKTINSFVPTNKNYF
jgi:hypothetical protein